MGNLSAITLIKIVVVNKSSKRIRLRYHFLHEKVLSGKINIMYCQSNKQLGDCLTKTPKNILV